MVLTRAYLSAQLGDVDQYFLSTPFSEHVCDKKHVSLNVDFQSRLRELPDFTLCFVFWPAANRGLSIVSVDSVVVSRLRYCRGRKAGALN